MKVRSWPKGAAPFRILYYLLVAIALIWPLGRQIGSHLPLGTEPSGTVPFFNLWTLMWNADRLQHGYNGYWDAPIFYPETGTFALSEPQPLTGLLFALLAWISRNPITAYNLILLLFLGLNSISADWLLQKLGVTKTPAFLSGLLALTLPFVWNELGVLQLTAVFPIFFTLGSLWTFSQKPNWHSVFGIGVWSAATFLTSNYYGLFLTLFVFLGGILLVRRTHIQLHVGLKLIGGLLVAGLMLLPFLTQQARLTADYSRSDTTIQANSAELEEYSHLHHRTLGGQWLPWVQEDDGRQRLFPGTILILLGVAGLSDGLRSPTAKRWAIFAFLGAAIAFVLSLGLNLSIGPWQPYRLLMDNFPGYAQLRSPFRMAIFVQIFLVTLAGLSLNNFWRRGWVWRFLAVVMVIAGMLEVLAWPARLAPVPNETFESAWIDWLRNQPETGAVLMLPMSENANASAFEPIVIGMLQGLEHGRPLGNGYSGFFPTSYRSLKGRMIHFPDDETVRFLQETGFRFLIIDQEWWTQERSQSLSPWTAEVERVYEDEQKVIYELLGVRVKTTIDENQPGH